MLSLKASVKRHINLIKMGGSANTIRVNTLINKKCFIVLNTLIELNYYQSFLALTHGQQLVKLFQTKGLSHSRHLIVWTTSLVLYVSSVAAGANILALKL
jgi:hypothetical protein